MPGTLFPAGWATAAAVRITATDWKGGGGAQIATGHETTLHYSIAPSESVLEAGDFTDSSYDRGDPISVVIGAGELAPGLDSALIGAREGGTRRMFVGAADGAPDETDFVLDIFVVSVADSAATEAWRQFDSAAVER
jgi:hypothetical protein